MQRLNAEGRRKVKLLKDTELIISTKAQDLMKEIEDYETYFLHRKMIRSREEGKFGWQVST